MQMILELTSQISTSTSTEDWYDNLYIQIANFPAPVPVKMSLPKYGPCILAVEHLLLPRVNNVVNTNRALIKTNIVQHWD